MQAYLKDDADPKPREFNDRARIFYLSSNPVHNLQVVRMEVRDGCMVTLYQHFFDKITKKSKNSPEVSNSRNFNQQVLQKRSQERRVLHIR